MELLSLYLGLEQLKDRINKSSTMSQALRSTDIPEWQNKEKHTCNSYIVKSNNESKES
jgi:hypothetical protein